MSGYLKVHDWDKWQSFRKDRGTPTWIKLHRCLLTSRKWASLTDAEKGQMISLWIVAADKNGLIPENENVLRKICAIDKNPPVKKFKDLGLLEEVTTTCQPTDNQLTTTCQPTDGQMPAQSRVEKSREDIYGTFDNVKLSKKEFSKIKEQFPDHEDRINRLSEYISSKGKRYKSHYATILSWARKDKNTNPAESEWI